MSKGKRLREKRLKGLAPKKRQSVLIQEEVVESKVEKGKEYWITGYYFDGNKPTLVEPFCASKPFSNNWHINNLDKVRDYFEYSTAKNLLSLKDKTMKVYEDRMSAIRFLDSIENELTFLNKFSKVASSEDLIEYADSKGEML